jgi:CubicO group peptidase (beta-lactamase class C family)
MNQSIVALQNYLNSHFQKSELSVLHIGLLYNNQEYHFEITPASKKKKEVFGLGSISKTFISTWLSKAIYDQRIDIEATIDNYLSLYDKFHGPSILELATHSSGYQYFVPYQKTIPTMLMYGFNKKNIYHELKDEWFQKYISERKPRRLKRYRYADVNYALLAKLIEHIEKKPFIEAMTDFIHNEMGLNETFYINNHYSLSDSYSWNWNDGNPFIASGGVFSTSKDLIKYLKYQIDNKDSQRFAHHKYVKTNNKSIYSGFSWISFEKSDYYWHIGGQGYYRSYVGFNNKRNIGVCILSTVDINVQHVGRIGSYLYKNLKRNPKLLIQFLQTYSNIKNQNEPVIYQLETT